MMRNLKIIVIVLLITVCLNNTAQCQDFSKNTLKYGVGYGGAGDHNSSGSGWLLILGYQRDLWKDRLRLNPNFIAGYFNSKNTTDGRDQWFNTLDLEAIVFFDLIKIKAFSFTIGAGGVVNNTKGLLGTGGFPPGAARSEYFSDWNYGGLICAGFRINPKNSRLAFDLIPYTFHLGGNNYEEAFVSVGFELKLK